MLNSEKEFGCCCNNDDDDDGGNVNGNSNANDSGNDSDNDDDVNEIDAILVVSDLFSIFVEKRPTS